MNETEYYIDFEQRLLEELARICPDCASDSGMLLGSDDIDEKWMEMGPEYMAEAVTQLNEYPEAALGWAAYVGLAVAQWWDGNWSANRLRSYASLHGSRGFDDMDEHIIKDILRISLESSEAVRFKKQFQSITYGTISFIRHEGTEAQTTKAYYTFAHAVNVIFRIGVSLGLKRLGYKYKMVPGALS